MWQEMKSMSQKDQLCIVVRHDDFKAGNDHIELHTVKRYFRVTTEGDRDLFFDVPPTTDNVEANEAQTPLPTAVDEAINGHSEEVNTIEALQGIAEIDDDNEPAEENVPTATATTNRILSTEWGHDGFCFRKSQNLATLEQTLLWIQPLWASSSSSLKGCFQSNYSFVSLRLSVRRWLVTMT